MTTRRTLQFSHALRSAKPVPYTAMIKPVGTACNLRCAYCYYLDKEILHSTGVISDERMERFVSDYIASNVGDEVLFCFHGGEPLLAGIDFYHKVIGWQQKYAGRKRITNTLQTNGTKIDQRWAEFFAEHDFLIGISIDGPEEVHNARRGNSWAAAMRGLECLKRAGVEFNTLSAVSSASAGRGADVYQFLKSIGSRYMQFLPVAEFLDDGHIAARSGQVAQWSIGASDWGQFLIDVFDRWVICDVGQYFVTTFDAVLAGYCGVPPGICAFGENCGSAVVVEHTGDVYSCDHFVYPQHRLGSIDEKSLGTMVRSGEQFRFGAAKSDSVGAKCRSCLYLPLCHGECPKHRDESGDNLLCDGYVAFFRHSRPYFEQMRELLERGIPASAVADFARTRMGL